MMRRVMIQADEELLDRARRVAANRGVSMAFLVREALERELGPPSPVPEIESIGVFDSGRGDLGRRTGDDEFRAPPFRS